MKRKLNVHSIGKCLLTLLLSLCMMVTLLPVSVAAEEGYSSISYPITQVTQPEDSTGKSGCYTASLAMCGLWNGTLKGTPLSAYKTIYMMNGDRVKVSTDSLNYVGYIQTKENLTLTQLYNYLKRGPVIVGEHCNSNDLNHYSVVYAYTGDTSSLSESGFQVMDTKEKAYTLSDVTYLTDNGKTTLDKWIKGSTYMSFTYYKNTGSGSSGSSGSSTPSTTPTTDISRDIVLVLDTSGSMSGTSLTYTKAAATKFVDQILGASKSTNIAIVTYASSANTLIGLTNDKAALTKAIDGISANGMTNIYTAMQAADTILQSSKANKKAIVIMSDGDANEGTTATAQTITTEEKDSVYFTDYGAAIYAQAEGYKKNSSYTIYSLGFGLEGDTNAYNLLKYIATYSNGARKFWSVTKDNLDDIVFTYEDIANTATAKIIIAIDCPVTAAISRGSETLDKDNTAASFGSVAVTSVADGYKYVFTLDDGADYDIKIRGSADGAMNFKITYVYGDTEQYHGSRVCRSRQIP